MRINCPCPRLRRGPLAALTALLLLLVSGSAAAHLPAPRGGSHLRSSGRTAARRVCVFVKARPKAKPGRRGGQHRQKIRRVRACVTRSPPKKPKKHKRPVKKGNGSTSATNRTAQAPTSRYIDSTFFGQHLENFPSWPGILTPPWPVTAIRLWDAGVTWCDLNPAPNQYNWAPLDSWLAYAANTGADLVYTFGNTPGWAVSGGQGGCGSSGNQPPQGSAWTSFVTALVQHANGRIKYFELWNEWDFNLFWAQGLAPMVALANAAAPIIHGAHQGLMLLTPSVTAYDGGGALENFLGSVLPSSGTIDIVNVHTYTQSSQGQGLWPEDTLYTWIGKVRNVMQGTGYAAYPLWSTEGGWGANTWFSGYNDAASQRAFVARYDLALLSLGLGRAYWYAYGNPAWDTLWTPPGLGQPGGVTPAGIATKELLGWLSGAKLVAPCAQDSRRVWTCDITRPGGYVGRILWATSGSRTVQTPAGYATLRTLNGGSDPVPPQLTASIEPVLIES
jgi:polysaccharide biosynthesis protein PslG